MVSKEAKKAVQKPIAPKPATKPAVKPIAAALKPKAPEAPIAPEPIKEVKAESAEKAKPEADLEQSKDAGTESAEPVSETDIVQEIFQEQPEEPKVIADPAQKLRDAIKSRVQKRNSQQR